MGTRVHGGSRSRVTSGRTGVAVRRSREPTGEADEKAAGIIREADWRAADVVSEARRKASQSAGEELIHITATKNGMTAEVVKSTIVCR